MTLPLRDWPACVLLSGGMDSVAALHWALAHHEHVRALLIDYGQPHRDRELPVAGEVCARRRVPQSLVVVADALRPLQPIGLLAGVEEHDPDNQGTNAAFLPGRNLAFLSIAAVHSCTWWPRAPRIDLVLGACREDAAGFPDCGEAFLQVADRALSIGCAKMIHVAAPWVRMPKAMILDSFRGNANALEDIACSWSCYRGERKPCGWCTACVMRAQAFAQTELVDQCRAPELTGGDVHRDRGLR